MGVGASELVIQPSGKPQLESLLLGRLSSCAQALAVGTEAPFVVILSLICLIAGVTLAAVASKRSVRQQALLESTGGSLIVLGLAIIGIGLPLLR